MTLPADDSALLLLHNPRCSKSRAALALLQERHARFDVRLYLDDPLSRAELVLLRSRLRRPAIEWARKKEDGFVSSGLAADSGDDLVLDLMAAHPIVIERPILIRGDRAVVGRPPEDILSLL